MKLINRINHVYLVLYIFLYPAFWTLYSGSPWVHTGSATSSIKTIFKPNKKVSQFLRPVKSNIPLQCVGVYKLDCDCGLSYEYIGQTKRSIDGRVKENVSDIKNGHVLKSAVCEHTADNHSHYIKFDKAKFLAKEHRYIPRMICEVIEIQKHSNSNREDGRR